jgi:hypothetical protein
VDAADPGGADAPEEPETADAEDAEGAAPLIGVPHSSQ